MKTAFLALLAITFALTAHANSVTPEAGDNGAAAKPRQLTEKEKRLLAKAEKRLYARIKADGGISDPSFPLILYVQRIEGAKLIGVEFMRRDPSCKAFDLVGRAKSMEIRFDAARQQFLLDFRNSEGLRSDGVTWFVESKIWPMDLPAGLTFLKAKSGALPRKEDLKLSAYQRHFLVEGLAKATERALIDEKLRQAFGPDCPEFGRPLRRYFHSYNLVLSAGAVEKTADGRTRYTECSIAQFRKQPNGEYTLHATVRNSEVLCNLQSAVPAESADITFECSGGVRLGVKKSN